MSFEIEEILVRHMDKTDAELDKLSKKMDSNQLALQHDLKTIEDQVSDLNKFKIKVSAFAFVAVGMAHVAMAFLASFIKGGGAE